VSSLASSQYNLGCPGADRYVASGQGSVIETSSHQRPGTAAERQDPLRPLSIWTYFVRNKRRAIPVLLMIALAVVGVSVISVVAESQIENAEISWVRPLRNYATVTAAQDVINPAIIQEIENHPDVERVLPYQSGNIRVPSLLGSQGHPLIGLHNGEMTWFMERTNLSLTDGRLPAPGANEIMLHETIMRARNLEIGDLVGREVDEREWFRGRWEIVGVFSGPIPGALLPYDVMRETSPLRDVPGEVSLLVFPQPGRMETVDAYIRGLPRHEVLFFTYTTERQALDEEIASVQIVVWIINIVTISVLSLAMGLLNTIYFMQRMSEYGTLAAIGYRIRFLVRRTFGEAMSLTIVAWLLGLALAWTLALTLRTTVFEPRGLTLSLLTMQSIYYTIPIPVLIAVFSLGTVIRQLTRLDPVTIVERRD
jgi:ABC-type lipoprotein release transport system permease subunit